MRAQYAFWLDLYFPRSTPAEHRLYMPAGVGAFVRGDLLGGAGGDDFAASVAAFRAEVDDPVGGLDDVEVVFDDDDGVAAVAQPMQDFQQQFDVVEVQAGRRLVEQVQRPAGAALRRPTTWSRSVPMLISRA